MKPTREGAVSALALEKQPTERAARLDRECEGNPAPRQRLGTLLAAQEQPDTLLALQAEGARPTIEFALAS